MFICTMYFLGGGKLMQYQKVIVFYNEWHPGKFSNLSGTAQTFEEPYPEYVMGGSYAVWCDDPKL